MADFAVLAGSCQLLWMPEPTTTLSATVAGGEVEAESVQWKTTRAPGGGEVAFDDEGSLETNVTLNVPGAYILTCEVVSADGKKAEGSLVIEVYSEDDDFGGYAMEFLTDVASGNQLKHEFDFEGFNWDVSKPPPDPYVHPRVHMNPEDIPALREKWENMEEAKQMIKRVKKTIAKLRQTKHWKILKGEEEGEFERKEGIVAGIVYELLFARIMDDEEVGKECAPMLAKIAQYCEEEFDKRERDAKKAKQNAKDNGLKKNKYQTDRVDYRVVYQPIVFRKLIAVGYDFGYDYMDSDQQLQCRRLLLKTIDDIWCIGMECLPMLDANRSNWCSHFYQILHIAMAVEYESADDLEFDAGTYARSLASMDRYFHFAIASDGSGYEGMGKCQAVMDIVIAAAKRGYWPLASKTLRNHFTKFYPYNMFPWGKNNHAKVSDLIFTWDESLGGTGQESRYADVALWHACFPSNSIAHLVHRAELQDDFCREGDFNIRFPFKSLDFHDRLLFMTDVEHCEDWGDMYRNTMEGQPLSFFSDDMGRLMTHSKWDPDAVQFFFQPRHQRGGHGHNDRNKIMFYALGETWLEDTGSNSATSFLKNVCVVNDNDNKPGLVPSKTIAYADLELITVAAGDARASYAGSTGPKNKDHPPFTMNDFRFEKKEVPSYDVPIICLPDWENGHRKTHKKNNAFSIKVETCPPVACRTAGLVRGDYPYAIVIDDLQRRKNGNCKYSFQLVIPRHLCKADKEDNVIREGRDVIIKAKNSDKRCLIRFLDAAADISYEWRENGYTLACSVEDVLTPEFKVIIYAYREDQDPLPETEFDGESMTISIGDDQSDVFALQKLESGRNSFVFSRNGEQIMDFAEHNSPNGDELFVPPSVIIQETPADPRETPRE